MSRRYLASLAIAAVLILAAGLLVRRTIARADAPVHSAPPSEASTLQQLSQEGQLRRMSAFVAERAASAAAVVEFVAATDAAGLRWHGDTVVTTSATSPVLSVAPAAGDTLSRAVADVTRDASAPGAAQWVIAVGRLAADVPVTAAGLAGGRAARRCGERDVEELVLGFPLHERLAGAGLFALDGQVVGLVVRCPDRVAAIPASEVARLLAESLTPARRAQEAWGFTAEPLAALDARARDLFGTDSGVVVTAVRRGSVADAAGIAAGDVLASADESALVRRRGTAVDTLLLAATSAPAVGVGVEVGARARGVTITAVHPGSAAAAAGLRTGDRLLRVDRAPVASAADARRLLDAPTPPRFIAFERDAVERGVILPATP